MRQLQELRWAVCACGAAMGLIACGAREDDRTHGAADDLADARAEAGAVRPIIEGAESGLVVPAGRAGPPVGDVEWALSGDWRTGEEIARDAWLKPRAIIQAVAITPDAVVLEVWPGSGHMAGVLGPWLGHGGGRYIVGEAGAPPIADAAPEDRIDLTAGFIARLADTHELAWVERVALTPGGGAAAAVQADIALSIDDVPVWMALGEAEATFSAVHAALKPGGVFAVITPRGDDIGIQDPGAVSGYVQPRYVRLLAEEAGFEWVAALDLLENPADTADHPFGAWSLKPYARTAPHGAPADAAFDRSALDAIGEPRRMFLIFAKPLDAG